ncbi:Cathepsin B precursor [Giardia duodenalis ATCC 50581]|uniref:Cathepsin B n=2 Tax=Giardia intestinalis TaxID=5741 RepID=C6LTD9_GIAIB|nr:Cathepsin B precursor [Giardia intestinalis ATCC 50581]
MLPVATCLLLVLGTGLSRPLLSARELRAILSLHPAWDAGMPDRFAGLSEDDLHAMFPRHDLAASVPAECPRGEPSGSIPASFDFREEYPQCITPVYDQGHCGSCWAFSATSAFGDRRCMQGLDSAGVPYSQQYTISCDYLDLGCAGGLSFSVWTFLTEHGTTTLECVPYTDANKDISSPCPDACADGSEIRLVKADGCLDYSGNVTAIMQALANDGPVQASMAVYRDFLYYRSGVYRHVYGSQISSHAVEIIGYGAADDEDSTPYWIVKNSLGSGWGEEGYFNIVRGSNECDIESAVYSGLFLSSE